MAPGSFAVQLAKLAGAEVTGVDNGGKLDFMRSLGADHVVDYTRADFTRNGERYDLVLDLVAHRSVLAYRRALAPDGRYLYVGGSVPTLLQVLLLGPLTGRKIRMLAVRPNERDLLEVARALRGRRPSHRSSAGPIPLAEVAGGAAPPRRRARPRQGGRHGRRRVRIRSTTSAVQPVWCQAPSPAPLSPWKYSGNAHQVLPVRVGLEQLDGAVDRAAGPSSSGTNSDDQPAGQVVGDLGRASRLLPRAGRVLDQQVVAEERARTRRSASISR